MFNVIYHDRLTELHVNRTDLMGMKILLISLLLWLRKTINVLMFSFRRMPGQLLPNL